MKLNEYFEEHKIRNSDICSKSGIAESTLSQFLTGKRKSLHFANACKLADALGITLDKFRELTDENIRGDLVENVQNYN